MSRRTTWGALAVAALAGCAAQSPLDGTWALREIDGDAVASTQTLTFETDGGRVNGNGGCNRFQGPASVDGTRVRRDQQRRPEQRKRAGLVQRVVDVFIARRVFGLIGEDRVA